MSLHKWGEHDHPTLTLSKPENGNGLILYFLVENIHQIWENALELDAQVEVKPHLSPNSGRMEFSVRDLDNYYISICAENNG